MDFGVHVLQLSPHFFNVVVSVLGFPVGDLQEISVGAWALLSGVDDWC